MSPKKPAFEHLSTTDDDENNIDMETLQARIDMSMSYAQDLVSSWIEPNKIATTSRSHDLEKELKEYMKRPQRLGVGASIPEENNISRERACLKGRLRAKIKSKRPFDEVEKRENNSDDDDEESKASVIKKKAKFETFVSMSLSNKKSKSHQPSRAIQATQESTRGSLNVGGDVTRKPSPVKPVASPISQLRATNLKGDNSTDCTATMLSKREATKVDTAPSDTPFTSPSKVDVLNLDGPPPSEDDRMEIQANSQSRKKRRRRRKMSKINNQ